LILRHARCLRKTPCLAARKGPVRLILRPRGTGVCGPVAGGDSSRDCRIRCLRARWQNGWIALAADFASVTDSMQARSMSMMATMVAASLRSSRCFSGSRHISACGCAHGFSTAWRGRPAIRAADASDHGGRQQVALGGHGESHCIFLGSSCQVRGCRLTAAMSSAEAWQRAHQVCLDRGLRSAGGSGH